MSDFDLFKTEADKRIAELQAEVESLKLEANMPLGMKEFNAIYGLGYDRGVNFLPMNLSEAYKRYFNFQKNGLQGGKEQ